MLRTGLPSVRPITSVLFPPQDCRTDAANRRLEGEPNKTRPQSTHTPPSRAQKPPNDGSDGKGEPNKTRPQSTHTPPSRAQKPPNDRSDGKDPVGHKWDAPKQRPIAHLVGKAEGSGMYWEQSKSEFTINHMSYRNGSLVIPDTGFYYVYSQVAFVGRNCSAGSLVLETTVLYQRPDYEAAHPLELMVVTQSACESAKSELTWHRSLRQGGVFHLKRNTLLSVKIKPLVKAEMEHHKTYFGAFKLQ
ncbi:lymphotoxin-alpha-like [Heptranchias perlo]|uniref:lymphotoxin-alpha-like n=1 Tax=Heptranchias perlo TaxID=212740 RepID=UPI00355A9220